MTRAFSLRAAGFAAATVLGFAGAARASNVSAGNEPPNVAGAWLNYDTTTLKDLRGHAILVEFWATW
jgi:hypothetical protein